MMAKGVIVLAMLLAARPGGHRRSHAECAGSLRAGRELRRGGHLVEAQHVLPRCVPTSCGAKLAKQCRAFHARLQSDTPSVVFGATDATGQPLVDVDVTVDGAPVTAHLDGRSIPVDPGWHVFVFTSRGSPPV